MRSSLVVMFLLLPAVPSGAQSVSLGSTQETYSFANAGALNWFEAKASSGRWAGMVRGEALRRFGVSDQGVAVGAAWKGEGQGAAFWAGGASDADVLARGWAEASYDRALVRGLYLEAAAKASDFKPAKVYAGSLAAFWQALPALEVSGRASQALTRFRRGPDKSYPGFLARARLGKEDGPWAGASAGGYKEAFEAGAPGATGAFTARVYGVEAGLKRSSGGSLRAGFEYEDRTNGTFVRRWTLSTGWSF